MLFNINGLSQDTTSWVQFDLGGASIQLPEYFIHTRLKGIDSRIGEFCFNSIVIRYDYGGMGMTNLKDSCNLAKEEKETLEMFEKEWFKNLYYVPERCNARFVIFNDNPGDIIETKNPIGEIIISVSKCNSDIYFNIKADDLSFADRQLILRIGSTIKFE